MTPQELNERIDAGLRYAVESGGMGRNAFKLLINDVIQAVTPEKVSLSGDYDEEDKYAGGVYNSAIDTIQENTKHLIGEKRWKKN